MVMSQEVPSKPEYIVPTAGKYGMTTLHHAAYLNDPAAIRAELQRGIPVDVRDEGGWTPLHWSIDMAQAWGEPEQVVSQLLAAGASPNATDKSGDSVLMMACDRNNVTILDQLIQSGADIKAKSPNSTPLHVAASCDFHEGVRRLLQLGADPEALDYKGRTPKQVAKACGCIKSFRVLRTARPAT
jgi:ankyrin repeat protein